MKYKPVESYKPYIDPTMADDPTFINYLALAAAILDTNSKRRSEYYLKGLFDKEEGDTKMQEIDNLREIGFPTKAEHENDIEKMINKFNKSRYSGIPVIVINGAGTKEEYGSLKEACDEYDLKYDNVKQTFYNKKSDEIKYQGLIIKKL